MVREKNETHSNLSGYNVLLKLEKVKDIDRLRLPYGKEVYSGIESKRPEKATGHDPALQNLRDSEAAKPVRLERASSRGGISGGWLTVARAAAPTLC